MKAGFALSAVVLVTVGCGSRSGLLDRDIYVDSTSTSSGASGGAGGEGGAGGGPLRDDCALERTLPEIGLAGESVDQLRPAMTFTDADQREVTVAVGWRAGGGPMAPEELRHASFAPWDAWPSAPIGPVFLADFDGGRAFAIAASGGLPGNFSLAYSGPPTMGSTARVQPELTPGNGASSEVIDLLEPGRPLSFATAPGIGVVTQVQRQGMGQVLRHFAVAYSPGGASLVDQFVLGCGGVAPMGGTLPADIVTLENASVSFRVMFASTLLEDCGGGPLGPPSELYAVALPDEEVFSRSFNQAVRAVAQVAVGDESLYGAIGETGLVSVGRVGPQGFGASLDLEDVRADPTGGLDVARFADGRTAIAYRNASSGLLEVAVVASDLSGAESTYQGNVGQQPQLLASPNDDALLLAYQFDGERPAVVLSRLTCAP